MFEIISLMRHIHKVCSGYPKNLHPRPPLIPVAFGDVPQPLSQCPSETRHILGDGLRVKEVHHSDEGENSWKFTFSPIVIVPWKVAGCFLKSTFCWRYSHSGYMKHIG